MNGLLHTHMHTRTRICAVALLTLSVVLAGCGSTPTRSPSIEGNSSSARAATRAERAPATAGSTLPPLRGGGYYLNDGPGDNPPPNLDQVPDAIPKDEPLARGAMKPYTVMGVNYTPMVTLQRYKERGIASWYGRRYHGQRTSTGEIYDMYSMSAAHTTLPLPSYVRVTNLANAKSIVVRVNDRGPFRSDRLIDLSYTAAYKLGVLGGGKAMVEVEAILPGQTLPPPIVASVATPAPVTTSSSSATTFPLAKADDAVAVTAIAATASSAAVSNVADAASSAVSTSNADAPAPSVPLVTQSKGLFLQLGAFSSQDNADNYLARTRSQVEGVALSTNASGGLFKVYAGPYASQGDARAAADRISQALGVKPMLLTR